MLCNHHVCNMNNPKRITHTHTYTLERNAHTSFTERFIVECVLQQKCPFGLQKKTIKH